MNRDVALAGFGFSTDTIRPDLLDLDEILENIERSGAGFCELNLARTNLIAGGKVIAPMLRRLVEICRRHALGYTVHGPLAVNFMNQDNRESHQEVARAMLDICGAIGARVMVLHGGNYQNPTVEETRERHSIESEELSRLAAHARKNDCKVAVETLYPDSTNYYCASPLRLAASIRKINDEYIVGCLDLSHSLLASAMLGFDYEEEVVSFSEVANHVHVHDSFGKIRQTRTFSQGEEIAYGEGDIHLPPGWGAIPWTTLMPKLKLQPGTILNVELHERFKSETPNVSTAMREMVAYTGVARVVASAMSA